MQFADLKTYLKKEEVRETDGVLDIPVGLTVYSPAEPGELTPVMIYVVGTNTPRIGTASDEEILKELLEVKKYHVIVADYFGNEEAKPHGLDWSVEAIRTDIPNILSGIPFRVNWYYVLPAGYSITLDIPYWSYDEHGVVGTFERIVNIWNHDFRSCKAGHTVRFPDGTEKKIGDMEAKTIYDCVKPDDSPIDLNLYLDIIYPVRPKHDVPMMIMSSSSQTRVDCWAGKRPHLTGFLFAGYAGGVYDYSYTPMARDDHYGYFDGNWAKGHITGDNYTYSTGTFNSTIAETAAIRRFRYLAAADHGKYAIDVNKFGVYGNSKGGLCTRLGAKNPERFRTQRYLPGGWGQTRYEAGETEDDGRGIIRGAKPQPWLTYPDGGKIPSGVQFVYANCGGFSEFIMEGHAPTYASGSMKDGSYYYFYPHLVTGLKRYNVPSLHYDCENLAHALCMGRDREFGKDVYEGLFDIAHYWLKNDPAVYQWSKIEKKDGKITRDAKFSVTFSGPIPQDEIEKLTPKDRYGTPATGTWRPSFGKCTWTFTPVLWEAGTTYESYDGFVYAENGKRTVKLKSFSFRTEDEKTVPLSVADRFEVPADGTLCLRVSNDAHDILNVFLDGRTVGVIRLCGEGLYRIPLPKDSVGKTVELRSENGNSTRIIYNSGNSSWISAYPVSPKPVSCFENNGEFVIDYVGLNDNPYSPWKDGYTTFVSFGKVFKDTPLSEEDYGRQFRVSVSFTDTASRVLRFLVNPISVGGKEEGKTDAVDFDAENQTMITEPGKRTECSFTYTVSNEKYWTMLDKRTLTVAGESTTDPSTGMYHPLTLHNVSVTELFTAPEISSMYIKED